MSETWNRELDVAIATVRLACAAIKDFYDATTAQTYVKADESPVTVADEAAEKIQKVKDAVEYIEKNSPQN